MPSHKTSRQRKTRRPGRTSLRLECLESRLPLAGNVTAQLVGSTLLLTGDALGNELVVASAAGGTMAVFGNGTTINGAAAPFVTTKPVTNIVANLDGGSDVIGFGNAPVGFGDQLAIFGVSLTPPFDAGDLEDAIKKVGGVPTFSLPGSLTVTTGDGNDFVGIIGNVGGSVVANLGSALTDTTDGNAFVVGYPLDAKFASRFRIGGAVSVVGGAQNDSAYIKGTDVGGTVSAAFGKGQNQIGLYDSTSGAFAFASGDGDDFVDTAALTVRNGVSVSTGAGDDEVYLHAHGGPATVVGGGVVVNTGAGDDLVSLKGDFERSLSVTTGIGDDVVFLSDSRVGLGLALNTGIGNDWVGVNDTYVDRNAVIDTVGGDDRVSLVSLTVRYNLFVHLGAGDDALVIDSTKALAACLFGGTGTNALGIDNSSQTGIRTLRTYQFQKTVA